MSDMIDRRPRALIREHYETERLLARKLMKAPADRRVGLYTAIYDELFQRVPHHPQLTRKASPEKKRLSIRKQVGLLERFLERDTVFLEIGAGDCALVYEICKVVKFGYGLDVSKTITDHENQPENFELLISNGTSVDVPGESIDVAYSNQVMEHLHPDDALTQLVNIFRALKPGGAYICVTPSRLNGPHDISRAFDNVATCLHLKEYTIGELEILFQEAGFKKTTCMLGIRGRFRETGLVAPKILEYLIAGLPSRSQGQIANLPGMRNLIYPRIVARK